MAQISQILFNQTHYPSIKSKQTNLNSTTHYLEARKLSLMARKTNISLPNSFRNQSLIHTLEHSPESHCQSNSQNHSVQYSNVSSPPSETLNYKNPNLRSTLQQFRTLKVNQYNTSNNPIKSKAKTINLDRSMLKKAEQHIMSMVKPHQIINYPKKKKQLRNIALGIDRKNLNHQNVSTEEKPLIGMQERLRKDIEDMKRNEYYYKEIDTEDDTIDDLVNTAIQKKFFPNNCSKSLSPFMFDNAISVELYKKYKQYLQEKKRLRKVQIEEAKKQQQQNNTTQQPYSLGLKINLFKSPNRKDQGKKAFSQPISPHSPIKKLKSFNEGLKKEGKNEERRISFFLTGAPSESGSAYNSARKKNISPSFSPSPIPELSSGSPLNKIVNKIIFRKNNENQKSKHGELPKLNLYEVSSSDEEPPPRHRCTRECHHRINKEFILMIMSRERKEIAAFKRKNQKLINKLPAQVPPSFSKPLQHQKLFSDDLFDTRRNKAIMEQLSLNDKQHEFPFEEYKRKLKKKRNQTLDNTPKISISPTQNIKKLNIEKYANLDSIIKETEREKREGSPCPLVQELTSLTAVSTKEKLQISKGKKLQFLQKDTLLQPPKAIRLKLDFLNSNEEHPSMASRMATRNSIDLSRRTEKMSVNSRRPSISSDRPSIFELLKEKETPLEDDRKVLKRLQSIKETELNSPERREKLMKKSKISFMRMKSREIEQNGHLSHFLPEINDTINVKINPSKFQTSSFKMINSQKGSCSPTSPQSNNESFSQKSPISPFHIKLQGKKTKKIKSKNQSQNKSSTQNQKISHLRGKSIQEIEKILDSFMKNCDSVRIKKTILPKASPNES